MSSSIASSLDTLAALADLHGHSRESVQLLMDASRKLKAGELDNALSGELIAWSLVASATGQSGLSDILQRAADGLAA